MKKVAFIIALTFASAVSAQMNPKEQLDVMNGDVYTFPSANYTLDEVIRQAAISHMADFVSTQKETEAGSAADDYKQKMLRVSRLLQSRPARVTGELTRVFIASLSKRFTYAQVSGAAEAQWINVIETNIGRALEVVASVAPAEKTAYEAL